MPSPVLVEGVRTPFLMSGTQFKELMPHELASMALRGLASRTAMSLSDIDAVIMGNVIQEVKTSNVARESMICAGYDRSVPAHTITMACISANQAVSQACNAIRAGQGTAFIAGGVESMSDVPIRFSRALRKRMIASQKVKSFPGYMKLLTGLTPGDLAPELPGVAEFTTNETMGHSADRLCSTWAVSRADQDAYAGRSHASAAKAAASGLLTDIIPVMAPPSGTAVLSDNGIRGSEADLKKLSTLKPSFIKPFGSVTAGNASFLTDGATASLIMSEERAKSDGLTPMARLGAHVFVGHDPKDELLLGPAYAICKLLAQEGLTLADIDVFEMHEAFAGQVLANCNAISSATFAGQKGPAPLGVIPMEKLNNWGGSLSIGHPFGATGVRLVTTAANRLKREGGNLALVAACAAGGQGTAMLVHAV